MRESYEKMTVLELRRVAKEKGVRLGAGISKQGIIDKLLGEEAPLQDPPAPQPAPAPVHRYSASIITDDENDDHDDVPVLTPNTSVQLAPRKVAPRPQTPSAQPSSLSSISSKAPAFTMEGSRAWHNPLAYQSQPAYQSRNQPRSAYGAQDMRYGARPQQPRTDVRPQRPAAPYQTPNRFGPDLSAQEAPAAPDFPQQESQNPPYRSEYTPRPQQDYIPPTAPEYARRDPYAPVQPPAPNAAVTDILLTGECGEGEGVLELHPEGYGFLRADNYLPGKNDVYVSNAQIRRFSLRSGDYIEGKTRPQQPGSRYSALLYITRINGQQPVEAPQRPSFDQLTAIYPKKRILLGKDGDLFLSAVDLLSPIGFGQRALIQAPPRAGRSTLIKKMACAIGKYYPDVHLMTLLIDERPEDVVDMKESIPGEVLYSSFDSPCENHIRVSELALERAQRLVELKQHVVLFVDSFSRLARAYNTLAPQTARALQNGLVPAALTKAKKLFGAARNTREGGSLTVIALMQTETQNVLDEAILQEFRNTANMELALERIPGEKRMVPCINAHKAATRHGELMLSDPETELAQSILSDLGEAAPRSALKLISLLEK